MTPQEEAGLRIYQVEATRPSRYTGNLNAAHRWSLPGLADCPGCGATWSTAGLHYPCVDLTSLPTRHEYEEPRPEPYEEWARLREQVRPQVPPGFVLMPGTKFGPMTGRASGPFGQLHLQAWSLSLRREALEQLRQAGLQGLNGCPMQLKGSGRNPPELLELQLTPCGRFHPDCLPSDREPPCPTCGVESYGLPAPYLLDTASIPTTADVFRLADWPTLILATQRFVDAVQRLELDGVTFRQVAVR
ncbi:double-CXXCG motif protein [Myxococcus sp. AB056]|uniref:SitI6 family double-CXXCG motif immunity protein n=1 Tax=Myxococcus sp. AB056 TaxID=2562792 RepID=UPI001146630A|nr:double-CXXCG motif protein [Myxococcus sp. AB056]